MGDENDLYEYSETSRKKPIFFKRIANKLLNRKNKENYDSTDITSSVAQPINELQHMNKKTTKTSLTSSILNKNNPKIIEKSESNNINKTLLNGKEPFENEDEDDDYEYDEETIIDSASILPRTKIVDANASSIIYRTP
jgi:hypothetical protein